MAEEDQVAGNPSVYRSGQEIECWLTDMDGVLVHENQPIPGAAELIQRWVDTSKRFLVLTNNSIFTPRDLAARLRTLRKTLFARVAISADEPPRVLPERDGVVLKQRFRAAIGAKA